jgi:SpoVK/Ycf46/Vps4 family AAA+-type ATPase
MGRARSERTADTAESRYAKNKTAEWILNLLESGSLIDEPLLDCAEWALGNFHGILSRLENSLRAMATKFEISKIYKKLHELRNTGKRSSICGEIIELVEMHACLKIHLLEAVRAECAVAAKIPKEEGAVYHRARQRLQRVFGLRKDACTICEFLFIKNMFRPVESYFEDSLEVFKFAFRKRLADMFRMKHAVLQKYFSELVSWGICDMSSDYCNLADGVDSFWENDLISQAENLFYRPLQGKTLPLERFDVPTEDAAHVMALLETECNFPIHVLLYGEPGTGKTTFARSLARKLNIKAWLVPCNDENGDNSRRAKLRACLNMASKHKNAFVLMDEADRFLDTAGKRDDWKSDDKAWLNEFLEQPGCRVIWIANDIGHIHPSVRRRFSYSVCFKPMDCEERRRIWRGILKEQRASNLMSEEQIKKLAVDYRVSPAIMESATRQAKILSSGRKDFARTAECVLCAHITLARNGMRPRTKSPLSGEYALDGVCLEGSVAEFLEKCRRIDYMMRNDKPLRPGGATMLFYGPPGSGKSALAKYLAREIGRELVVRRASDLLSPFVGMSEHLVAEAFREAEQAILMIDEADSFLYSRDSTARSWENTLVNEFLTSLEECCGFCVCTTNRMNDMDAAAIRRFSFKMSFSYADPEQARALYKSLLAPLVDGMLPKSVETELSILRRLTPGDFHTVKSQYWLAERGEVTHKQLMECLALEERLKQDGKARRVGFN